MTTNFFQTLAVDAYLKSVEVIKAEKTNVARMVVRYLADANDDSVLSFIKENLADYYDTDAEKLKVNIYYCMDDQWGIGVEYHDEYDDYCEEVPINKIYEFASLVCKF